MISLTGPDLDDLETSAIAQVLATGMLVQGPHCLRFEEAMADWLAPSWEAVAVSNGTAALHLALTALGIGQGDAVIVPTFSWPATANVVELAGARVVFVDIDPGSYAMSIEGLSRAIAAAQARPERLAGVMVVHPFGALGEMDGLARLCQEHGVPLIEDAACAIGSTWHGRHAGTLGTLGCFSFHPRKIVTTGEGGVVATDSPTLARTLRALRNHGLDPQADTPDFILPGFNYRMTDFQAAMGVHQLEKLPGMLSTRRSLCARYDAALAASRIAPQTIVSGSISNRQAYVVRLPDSVDRQTVIEGLRQRGIASTIGTWHIPLIRFYREKYGYRPGDFPVTDAVFSSALTLPLHSALGEDQIDFIVRALLELTR